MGWLWWRWMNNYIWLLNRIFVYVPSYLDAWRYGIADIILAMSTAQAH